MIRLLCVALELLPVEAGALGTEEVVVLGTGATLAVRLELDVD